MLWGLVDRLLAPFYPCEYMESVFAIDYQRLFDKGIRGIIFDIDMTLVPHAADATPEVEELFRKLHQIGFQTLLLTNNDEERTKRFLRNIDSLYICDANKPEVTAYLQALDQMQLRKEEAVYIGDQIFIDIYGANRSGIASILVQYVCAEIETKIGIRRNLEKMILRFYAKSKSYRHRLGEIGVREMVQK